MGVKVCVLVGIVFGVVGVISCEIIELLYLDLKLEVGVMLDLLILVMYNVFFYVYEGKLVVGVVGSEICVVEVGCMVVLFNVVGVVGVMVCVE